VLYLSIISLIVLPLSRGVKWWIRRLSKCIFINISVAMENYLETDTRSVNSLLHSRTV
jgi:hypothetical protein